MQQTETRKQRLEHNSKCEQAKAKAKIKINKSIVAKCNKQINRKKVTIEKRRPK